MQKFFYIAVCYIKAMKIAIIDLGTNTFNLLIGSPSENGSWKPVYKIKEAVKLGQGGINNGIIVREAFDRGIAAMERHFRRLKDYEVDKVFAFGTSALRDAANGQEFINEIKQRFNIDITLITGDKEAELIYKGVRQTVMQINERFLILDIGGGSNEFIIADKNQYFWKESYQLGMARLMDKFSPADPVSPELITVLEKYFEQELSSLFKALEVYPAQTLVGASGSFDSFVNMLHADIYPNDDVLPSSQEISIDVFHELYRKLIHSTTEERQQMKGLEPVRRDMIVLAVIFVNFVLKRLNINKLYQSSFSLKEGALWEMMQNS